MSTATLSAVTRCATVTYAVSVGPSGDCPTTRAEPFPRDCTTPSGLTATTLGSLDEYATVAMVAGTPSRSRAAKLSCNVSPSASKATLSAVSFSSATRWMTRTSAVATMPVAGSVTIANV